VERVSAQGAKHVLEAAVTGVVIGALAAIPAHLLLAARNLRWTWALAHTAVGAVAVWATVVEAWSVALLVGGLCSCRWAWLLERRDRKAGGEARRRVRRAVGVGDTLGRRRARRELRTGRLVADGGFLFGTDAKGPPVRLRFGGESGRHGLLLGASGSGKSNALVWTVSRHMEAGFGVVVIDMKADPALAARLRVEAEHRRQPFYFWSLDGGDRWNPLQRGNRSELKDKLIATEEFSERHYQAMYERYLVNLFRTLEHKPAERHLRNVVFATGRCWSSRLSASAQRRTPRRARREPSACSRRSLGTPPTDSRRRRSGSGAATCSRVLTASPGATTTSATGAGGPSSRPRGARCSSARTMPRHGRTT
jgi:hypothetical protein